MSGGPIYRLQALRGSGPHCRPVSVVAVPAVLIPVLLDLRHVRYQGPPAADHSRVCCPNNVTSPRSTPRRPCRTVCGRRSGQVATRRTPLSLATISQRPVTSVTKTGGIDTRRSDAHGFAARAADGAIAHDGQGHRSLSSANTDNFTRHAIVAAGRTLNRWRWPRPHFDVEQQNAGGVCRGSSCDLADECPSWIIERPPLAGCRSTACGRSSGRKSSFRRLTRTPVNA